MDQNQSKSWFFVNNGDGCKVRDSGITALGQLGLGRADARSRGDKEAARRPSHRNEATWKDAVYVILELSLRRSKGQPVDTVTKSTSLHLKTPDEHPQVPTEVREGH